MDVSQLIAAIESKLIGQSAFNGIAFSLSCLYKGNFTAVCKEIRNEQLISNQPAAVFRLASLTKQFTAAAVTKLITEKKIDYQTPINSIIPQLPVQYNGILIYHLLNHCSGIIDYEEVLLANLNYSITDTDVLQFITRYPNLYFEPGSQFRYSNTAYCLLACIVEKITGIKFPEYLQSEILVPAGMHNSGFYPQKLSNRIFGHKILGEKLIEADQSLTSTTFGDGGLYSNGPDYYNWFVKRKKFTVWESYPIRQNTFYNSGWFIQTFNGKNVYSHTGTTSGFSNVVIEIPEDDFFILFLLNVAHKHDLFLPLEHYLKENKILPAGITFADMHQLTS